MLQLTAPSLVVIGNSIFVSLLLVGAGAWLAHGGLSATEPSARQNVGEWVLQFFVGKAREMAHGEKREQIMRLVTSLLATAFLFIIASNLIAILPIPVLNRPPTSHFSVTLALALCAVVGTLIISATVKGVGKTLVHLFWPNPLQWVSEITDVMSLSLRLFGNIAGEYMTVALVLVVVPWGIPIILHALGLIPAFVQALVFTLLTASFLANAIHVADEEPATAESTEEAPAPATAIGRLPAEGRS
ncbi:MAG: F0F1 ATP synthase subunit A [Coriobacteriia bacterium]|nr:F0F1 ATP synthase subunit A [Coriobacteriia bacterium]